MLWYRASRSWKYSNGSVINLIKAEKRPIGLIEKNLFYADKQETTAFECFVPVFST